MWVLVAVAGAAVLVWVGVEGTGVFVRVAVGRARVLVLVAVGGTDVCVRVVVGVGGTGVLVRVRVGVDATTAVEALRARVVDPLRLPEGTHRVLISPAGALSYVPFALLLGGRDVAYVPSGTTYGLLLADAGRRGDGVLALGSPRLVYVSCDVPTLARDARALIDAGYRIGELRLFDLFPNTAHVESVAVFDRDS